MRDRENNYLMLCLSVLDGENFSSLNEDEVNILSLASALLVGSYPKQSDTLGNVSRSFFETKQYKKLNALEMLKGGFVLSLPRFKSMLMARL